MVQFLFSIVTCDFYWHAAHVMKNQYNFHDIKLPVATSVIGF